MQLEVFKLTFSAPIRPGLSGDPFLLGSEAQRPESAQLTDFGRDSSLLGKLPAFLGRALGTLFSPGAPGAPLGTRVRMYTDARVHGMARHVLELPLGRGSNWELRGERKIYSSRYFKATFFTMCMHELLKTKYLPWLE